MKNVLGVGNALVDVMKMLPDDSVISSLGFPKGSMQLVDAESSQRIKDATNKIPTSLASGGSAANTIHGLAMLGVEAGYIGSVGRDDAGDFFEKDMRSAGVNTYLLRRETQTGTAVAMVSPDTERTFATHLGAAVELGKNDIRPNLFTGYDFLYMEGYLISDRDMVEETCKTAREKGLKVAIDLASFNVVEQYRNDFLELIEKYVDVLFANEEEAKALSLKEGEEALGFMAAIAEIAVMKTGSKGSLVKRGEELIKIGTIDVQSKDTTGAGDLYASGFLFGLCNDENLDNCGAYGSILAGNVIESIGPKMSSRQWERIQRSIREINGNLGI